MSQADAINQMLYTIGSQLLRSRDRARSFWGLAALDEDAVVRNRLQPYASKPHLPALPGKFQPQLRAQSPTCTFPAPPALHSNQNPEPRVHPQLRAPCLAQKGLNRSITNRTEGRKNTTKLKTLLIFQFMKCHTHIPLTYKTHWVCQNILWLKPHPKWTEYVAHILMWS